MRHHHSDHSDRTFNHLGQNHSDASPHRNHGLSLVFRTFRRQIERQMRKKLTDLSIQKLPLVPEGSKKYWDTGLPGFGIRVTARRKSFFVVTGTKRKLTTLGSYPELSLKDARTRAKAVQVGEADPDTQNPSEGLEAAKRTFLADCRVRLRPNTYRAYERYLSTVTADQLSDINRKSIDTNHPEMTAAWKAFFNWCIANELTTHNPFTGLRTKSNARDRVLTDDEIRAVWAYDFPPFSNVVKLLLLTGLRRTEVTHLQLEGEHFVLPAAFSKNKKPHSVPATAWGQELFRHSDFTGFSGWSKAKARLDRHVPLPHWTLHDLRRSYVTIHARIGTPCESRGLFLMWYTDEWLFIMEVFMTTVRELNDKFRTTLQGGRVMLTTGVAEMEDIKRRALLNAVMTFDNFSEDNDPYGEHDFGSIIFDEENYFWKIDAFDNDLEHGSPDPANAFLTTRVLTIMRADEYWDPSGSLFYPHVCQYGHDILMVSSLRTCPRPIV